MSGNEMYHDYDSFAPLQHANFIKHPKRMPYFDSHNSLVLDKRHFSITRIASLIIIALIFAFAVNIVTAPTLPSKQAATAPTLPPKQVATATTAVTQNLNLAFGLLPQNLTVVVGDTFAVMVVVENVTDMDAWQVYLCFNQTVVECTGVSLPPNSVFSNSSTVSDILKDYNATEFPHGPLQRIQNDLGWVLAGECLAYANQTTFNGSCLLCRIEFKAVSPGSTALELLHDSAHTFRTYITTSDSATITSESTSCSYIHVVSN